MLSGCKLGPSSMEELAVVFCILVVALAFGAACALGIRIRVDADGRVHPNYEIGWALVVLGLGIFIHLMLGINGWLIPKEEPWPVLDCLRLLCSVGFLSGGSTMVAERRVYW